MKKLQLIVSWMLRIIASIILLQTLFFKFTAAPESVYIFTAVGIEPWGRIATGVAELIAAILLMIPATCVFGAMLSAGLMSGAIFFHVTKIGLVVMNDGGLLFAYCIIVFTSSVIIFMMHRNNFVAFVRKIFLKAFHK